MCVLGPLHRRPTAHRRETAPADSHAVLCNTCNFCAFWAIFVGPVFLRPEAVGATFSRSGPELQGAAQWQTRAAWRAAAPLRCARATWLVFPLCKDGARARRRFRRWTPPLSRPRLSATAPRSLSFSDRRVCGRTGCTGCGWWMRRMLFGWLSLFPRLRPGHRCLPCASMVVNGCGLAAAVFVPTCCIERSASSRALPRN